MAHLSINFTARSVLPSNNEFGSSSALQSLPLLFRATLTAISSEMNSLNQGIFKQDKCFEQVQGSKHYTECLVRKCKVYLFKI